MIDSIFIDTYPAKAQEHISNALKKLQEDNKGKNEIKILNVTMNSEFVFINHDDKGMSLHILILYELKVIPEWML